MPLLVDNRIMDGQKLTTELIKHYTMIARVYCNSDSILADDILSEICIKALDSKKTKISDLKSSAKNWAIDYLRSKRHNYSFGNAFQYISLEAMIDSGIQIDLKGNVYSKEKLYHENNTNNTHTR